MKEAGKPYLATIYPPSGKAPGEGHGLPFHTDVWFDDAVRFLEEHCR